MRRRSFLRVALIAAAVVFAWRGAASAQPCAPTPERHAVRIGGAAPGAFPEVAGEQSFRRALENGWVFALQRVENGWAIRLYEDKPIGNAVDLTGLTPPHGGAPNPRDILGWHFRNADNTGPNDGSVNAPQELRFFAISPALAGTGGYKPSADPDAPRHLDPGPDDGVGWLKVIDYGLAGSSLAPGARARMNYLKFDACLAWPRSDDERDRLLDAQSLAYTPEDREAFGGCGLDLEAFALEAGYAPRVLGGDIDGDGALDQIAQVSRRADGKKGLFVCRAGTFGALIGVDAPLDDMDPGYIDQIEAWAAVAPGATPPRSLAGRPPPQAEGDVILLERVERELVTLFWRDGALRAQRIYHIVEP